MNRRTFVGHISAGLALQYVPASLIAGSSSLIPPKLSSAPWLDKAVELIGNGSLGLPQRLSILRVYSPKLTPPTALLTMAHQDFDLASRLLKTNLVIDPNTLFTHSPLSRFGSFSTCFSQGGMSLTWQGLARIGRRATEVTRPTRTLRIMGSQ